MTSNKELFRQAKSFIQTLPRANTPSNKVFSTSDAVAHAFAKMDEALDARNKRLAYQHVATAVDLVVNNIGANGLDHELVFSNMKALQGIDKEFFRAFQKEVGRTFEILLNYGKNIPALYKLSEKNESLMAEMLKMRQMYQIMFSAESVDNIIDIVACGGTYSRMRIMVHLQTYEQEVANQHMAIFKSIRDEEGIERASKEHGDHVTKLMALLGKAAGGEELVQKESYNATSYIRNSVSTMFSSLALKDNMLRSRDNLELLNFGSSPDYDILEPIKSGKPNVFFLLNPLTSPEHLGAAVFEWGHALESHKPKTELTFVAPAMIPDLND